MSDFLTAAVLGVVEGVTEFLPVSSTGHLILVNQWLGFEGSFEKMFDVVIQLGAILAVVVYFWNRLWPFGTHKPLDRKIQAWVLWMKALAGVLPALVIGALFGDYIKERLFNPHVVAAALVVWGAAIILIENMKKKSSVESIERLSYLTALLIGLVQCLAMVPGTSRSAATIIGAMLFGCSRVVAAEFSFFLAIPTMVAASGYSFMKYSSKMTAHDYGVLAVGFFVSFIVALGVVSVFMKFIQKHDFVPFGIYRIILGAGVIVYFITR
jgi:undecaprenyl-diphosphatase